MAANIPLWQRRAKQAEKNSDRLIERYAKKYGHNFTINDLTATERKRLLYYMKAARAAYSRIVKDKVRRGVIKLK